MKRTVAKTSVRSREMALGFGGGEFFNKPPASPWVEPLLLPLSGNILLSLHDDSVKRKETSAQGCTV